MNDTIKIKTSELTGKALDYTVAMIEAGEFLDQTEYDGIGNEYPPHRFSTNWEQAGPIIQRELLAVEPQHEHNATTGESGWGWVAYVLGSTNLEDNHESRGPTLLISAMRCHVASKLGNEVEIPMSLLSLARR